MTYGRKAFGPTKKITLQEKAKHVADAIAHREVENREWRWATFGLEHNEAQIVRVWEELPAARQRAAARLPRVAL
jgi:hypothetical protein